MALCGGCGSESRRVILTMTANGKLLPEGERKEICPNCSPETFQEPFLAPADRRLWLEHEALPQLYHRRPDGFLELNDAPKADLYDIWQQDPDAEAREKAIARKRAQRRTTPLTQTEIDQAQKVWTPIVQEHLESIRQQEAGDLLYTENRVDEWLKTDHDATIQ